MLTRRQKRLLSPSKVVAPRRKPSPSTVVAPRRKLGFRAISTGNDAHDQVLTEAYEPDITQRAFVGAVLTAMK